jgi:hypothetical protein
MLNKQTTILVFVVTGVVIELAIQLLSGRREAWDSELYWTLGLPAAGLASLVIGFFSARGNWIWSVMIVPSQVLTMMVKSGEIGNLWPLTLVFSTILSAPFVIASFVGSRFRPKRFHTD